MRSNSAADSLAELLYESATSRVYRLRRGRETVVCKEPLGPQARARLQSEADILARLAGIAGVVQRVGSGGTTESLVLQDCGDTNLAQAVRSGPLPLQALLALARSLTDTIAAVHRAGVVHRDICPGNVLLAAPDRPVLVDFDSAAGPDARGVPARKGTEGAALRYLAPEQTGRTSRAVDRRADLYGLGATLYELATGRAPFETDDALQLVHDQLVREPVAPGVLNPALPAAFSAMVLRLLAKEPEQRYQSAEGLAHDLARLAAELASGGEVHFELGERDFAARLAAPERIVGREEEKALLRSAFEDAMQSPRRLLLIEGDAGVGKSALVGELRPLAAAASGWLVHGKFDLYQREAASLGAFSQALRMTAQLLLAQPAHVLEQDCRRIRERLGRNAALITGAVPEFGVLLGDPPPPPDADPAQAERRLQQTAIDLLAAIASPQRPLVVAMDNLQWAGAFSLRTFDLIAREPGLRGLMLVCAWRGGEVEAGGALEGFLRDSAAAARTCGHVRLRGLDTQELAQLVGPMLRLPPERAASLASAVSAVTGGNPFDTVETLNALRRDGLLRLSGAGWTWDEPAVRRFVGHANVLDLLAARIARLPQPARELLQAMSCLGGDVRERLLSAAAGLDAQGVRDNLHPAVQDGLAVDGATPDDVVRFRHERVQQAVLHGLEGTARARLQLAMARRLSARPGFELEAAQQYLGCAAIVADRAERHRVAALFHSSGAALAARANFTLAERYFAAACELLPEAESVAGEPAELLVEIRRALHTALYSLGRLEEGDALYRAIAADTGDPCKLVGPTCLQMRSLDIRGRVAEAMHLGEALLPRLGLVVPAGYDDPTTQRRFDEMIEWVRREARAAPAGLRRIEDARLLGIADVLNELSRSAFFLGADRALTWLLLESHALWVRHGCCPSLIVSVGRVGTFMSLRADYRSAYDICRHVLAAGEAFGWEPQTSEAWYALAHSTCHWVEPLESAYRHAVRAYQGVQAAGEVSYAAYMYRISIQSLLECAATLDEVDAEIDAGMAWCGRTGNTHAEAMNLCDRQLLRSLRGLTRVPGGFGDEQFDEQQFAANQLARPYMELTYHVRRALGALVFGEFEDLRTHAQRAIRAPTLPGLYTNAHAHLFLAVARAWEIQREPACDRGALLADIAPSLEWLSARAAEQPANFLHLAKLVEAERAWGEGDRWAAAATFDAALTQAQRSPRPWHCALIAERWGRFELAHGMESLGRMHLSLARTRYAAWGAAGKVAALDREHAWLPAAARDATTPGTPAPFSPDAVDLLAVLRASQALSSETSLERLTARVNEILAAMTGATRVCLLTRDDVKGWILHAAGAQPLDVAQAARQRLLPLSAIEYMDRTRETLLVDDAAADDRFARDPYLAGTAHCSLLLLPIAGQGAVHAMLYLERRGGRAAFGAQRLDAVRLVAGQLAVSLANVQLYESLEQRVQARTLELRQTQAQLVSTARRVGMAEVANNVLHNVGNVLNSVNISAGMISSAVRESRSRGLGRAVALLDAHADDLGRFLHEDERGRLLPAYFRKLVDALEQERSEVAAETDRLMRSVNHIREVVATQQAHAGAASMRDMERVADLLETALQMNEDALRTHGVTASKECEGIPPVPLDRSRLLQILVNLVRNAAEAMSGNAPGARALTLAATVVPAESGGRLRITVRDEGSGISERNLTRIFAHGFTTKAGGHGFGLHSSAVAAMEMGGTLSARSDGPGRGAEFTLEVPVAAGEVTR